jgi:hypothetical protein
LKGGEHGPDHWLQTTGAYWKRVKAKFDEHKITDKEYRNMHIDHSQNAIEHRWSGIQKWVNNVYFETIRARQESGTSAHDHVCARQEGKGGYGCGGTFEKGAVGS